MAGIRKGGMRPKTSKNVKSSSNKKRLKSDSAAQSAYKAKITARRAKRKAKKK